MTSTNCRHCQELVYKRIDKLKQIFEPLQIRILFCDLWENYCVQNFELQQVPAILFFVGRAFTTYLGEFHDGNFTDWKLGLEKPEYNVPKIEMSNWIFDPKYETAELNRRNVQAKNKSYFNSGNLIELLERGDSF